MSCATHNPRMPGRLDGPARCVAVSLCRCVSVSTRRGEARRYRRRSTTSGPGRHDGRQNDLARCDVGGRPGLGRLMRVFVTGGTGFVGSAVVRELLAAGHEVLALARSEASAARLTAAGATPQAGSLEDLDAIRAGASDADAVIHAAFDNSSVASFLRNSKIERAAPQAMGDALSGSRRPSWPQEVLLPSSRLVRYSLRPMRLQPIPVRRDAMWSARSWTWPIAASAPPSCGCRPCMERVTTSRCLG